MKEVKDKENKVKKETKNDNSKTKSNKNTKTVKTEKLTSSKNTKTKTVKNNKKTDSKIVKNENIKTKVTNNNSKTISKKVTVKKELNNNVVPDVEVDLINLENDIKKDIKKKNRFLSLSFIFTCVFLILFICLFVALHVLIPKIDLLGDNEVVVDYNGEYIEKGFKASIFNKDLTDKVEVIGKVDITKIGNYEISYILKDGIHEIIKKRNVKVVDRINPIITLTGGEKIEICVKDTYKELGYKANDEYDGDLTNKVVVSTSGDNIIYTVKDSSGNKTSITRKVVKGDSINPVISLKGKKTVYLGLENSYTEPGYSVSDNCDGNITSKVSVSGYVKEKVEGTYTLTYTVKDNNNNQTKVTRKVIVAEKTNPQSGEIKKGAIYLTFDDGPSSVTTPTILDILKEEGVKATFFVTNSGPDYLVKRIYDEGHTLALHTASHNYSQIYSSVDNYFSDLEKVSNRVKRLTGHTSKIVRFPGGSSNTVSRRYKTGIMTELSDHLFGRGYRYYDWNVDSGDASTSKTKDAVYKRVVNNLSKNKANIVLMHDIKIQTRDALRSIIKYGKDNGYTFEKIDIDTYMVRQKINN